MMTWIVWGGIGLFVLLFLIGLLAQHQAGKDMNTGGAAFVRFGGAVTLCTLLEQMKRPGSEDDGRIDIERIFPTALLAGRKVLGEALTEEMLKEELQTVLKYGGAYLYNVKEHGHYATAKKRCDIEQKDKIVLAAYTALQLNYQQVDVQVLPLRQFAQGFYDNILDADRRLTGEGGEVNLTEASILHANDIVRDLDARV